MRSRNVLDVFVSSSVNIGHRLILRCDTIRQTFKRFFRSDKGIVSTIVRILRNNCSTIVGFTMDERSRQNDPENSRSANNSQDNNYDNPEESAFSVSNDTQSSPQNCNDSDTLTQQYMDVIPTVKNYYKSLRCRERVDRQILDIEMEWYFNEINDNRDAALGIDLILLYGDLRDILKKNHEISQQMDIQIVENLLKNSRNSKEKVQLDLIVDLINSLQEKLDTIDTERNNLHALCIWCLFCRSSRKFRRNCKYFSTVQKSEQNHAYESKLREIKKKSPEHANGHDTGTQENPRTQNESSNIGRKRNASGDLVAVPIKKINQTNRDNGELDVNRPSMSQKSGSADSGTATLSINDSQIPVMSTSQGNLSQASTSQGNLSQRSTSQRNLSQPSTSQANLSQPSTSQANLSQLSTSQANLSEPSISQANLSPALTPQADLSQPSTSQADLSQPSTSQADLSQPSTSQADLSQPSTSQADLSQPSTSQADLSQPSMSQRNSSQAPTSQANKQTSEMNLSGSSTPQIKVLNLSMSQDHTLGVQTSLSEIDWHTPTDFTPKVEIVDEEESQSNNSSRPVTDLPENPIGIETRPVSIGRPQFISMPSGRVIDNRRMYKPPKTHTFPPKKVGRPANVQPQHIRGLTGLSNPGGYSHINSIIQCVCNTPSFPNNFANAVLHTRSKEPIIIEFGRVILSLVSHERLTVSANALKIAFEESVSGRDTTRRTDPIHFLKYLLHSLHCALQAGSERRNLRSNSLDTETEWLRSIDGHRSIISDLFYGQKRLTTTCKICKSSTVVYEPFSSLTIPLPPSGPTGFLNKLHRYNLTTMLADYFKEYPIARFECNQCGVSRDATTKIDLTKLPPILILHFERSKDDSPMNCSLLKYPLDDLKLKRYLHTRPNLNSNNQKTHHYKYKLYAVCARHDVRRDDCFFAECQNPRQFTWHTFVDELVTEVTEKQVRRHMSTSCLLFYRSFPGDPDPSPTV